MAITKVPFNGEVVTVAAAGTSVATSSGPYDNTSSVIIYNTDGTNTVLAEWVTAAGGALSANAVRVPPSTSMTLPIGPQSIRLSQNTVLAFDISGGTNINVELTYVNGLES